MKTNICKSLSVFLAASIGAIVISTGSVFALEMGKVQIHGFLSQGFLQTDENNYLAETKDGTFQFNEFGINFSTDLTDNLRVGMQFFGRDLGPVGNDEVVMDWAFLDYRFRDWLGIRVGKTKLVHGLYNETREMDMLRTSVMLPQSVYSELWRDSFSTIKGIAAYGSTPSSPVGNFTYDLQYGVMDIKDDGGFALSTESALSAFKLDVNDAGTDYLYTLGLGWNTPLNGLKFKGTYYDVHGLTIGGPLSGRLPYDLNGDGTISPTEGLPVSRFDYANSYMRGYVISAEYTLGDFTFAAEFAEEVNRGKGSLGYGTINYPETKRRGWYAQASYRFNSIFSAAISYSDLIPNTHDEDGDELVAKGRNDFEAWLKTWTFSTRFDVNDYWLVKLEASYNDGWGASDPMNNPPSELEPYWWLFAAKATVSF